MTDSNGDLVERVARAMYASYDDDTALMQMLTKDKARAAIAAVLDDLRAYVDAYEQSASESPDSAFERGQIAACRSIARQIRHKAAVEPGGAPKPISPTEPPQDS